MDGSYGVKGTVMDAIEAADIDSTFVYCCGPVPMLKAVEAKYTKGYMSFEVAWHVAWARVWHVWLG